MIKNRKSILFVLIAFALLSSGAQGQSTTQSPITIPGLIQKLPAQDDLEFELIFSALLTFDRDGILTICELLPSETESTKARYALSGLAKFVSRPGYENSRGLFAQTVLSALDRPFEPEIKSFLLSQLKLAGRDDVVDYVARFLSEEKLSAPAIEVLMAIGSKNAQQKLLEHLKSENQPNRAALVKALGELRCRQAVSTFRELSENPNPEIKSAALFALANVGDPEAESVLNKAIGESEGYRKSLNYANLQLLAKRLLERGENNACIRICQSVLNGRAGAAQKAAALTTLFEADDPDLVEELFSAFDEGDESLRQTALNLSRGIPGEKITRRWVGKLTQSSPSAAAKILRMLGERGDMSALPEIYKILNSVEKDIVLAAIPVVAKLDGANAIKPLLKLLEKNDDSDVVGRVQTEFFQFHTKDLVKPVTKSILKVTPPAQESLLNLLSIRKPKINSGILFKLASSDDRKVRSKAIKTLGILGRERDFSKLLNLLLRSENRSEQTHLQRSVASIVTRAVNSDKLTVKLVQKYQKAEPVQRRLLLQTIGKIENDRAFKTIVTELNNENEEIRSEAVRLLSAWKGEQALPELVRFARETGNPDHQILAIRGCLTLLGTLDISAGKKIRTLRELMSVAKRVDEKKAVLSAFGKIKTRASLAVVRKYLLNDSLKTEAALAAINIASDVRNQKSPLSRPEVALTLANAEDDPDFQNVLDNQFPDVSGLNQPPKGFVALFNGNDLSGWKGLVKNPVKRAQMSPEELAKEQELADQDMREHWTVQDGILVFDGKGHSLCTAKDYENFEMLVDWKIQKGGDSGIYLRGSPQVQIWDTAQWPEGSGGLYNNQKGERKPLEVADNPTGEWNTFRIKMIGERVTVYLNDILVVDNVVMENYWERDKPIYPIGQIELQAHSTPLYFRNIYIRELPREKQLFSGPLFNGKDLNGWEIIDGPEGSWKVDNGILYTNGGGGGWISTEREFGNFILELEFRVPEGGNSGVMIRAPHHGNPSYTGMEIQVLDDYAEKYAHLKPWQYTGSIYAVEPASPRVTKKAGQWQKMIIRCDGPLVQVNLNGTQIINTNLIKHMDKESGHPGIKRRKGYIGLQNHSTKIEYRKIRLTELKD